MQKPVLGYTAPSKENKIIGTVNARKMLMIEDDFDFRHHLRDTILLLGGDAKIADLLVKSQDGFIEKADIEKLRTYNIGLFSSVKSRLRNLNRLKLTVTPEP
jgi:hypothetical protein